MSACGTDVRKGPPGRTAVQVLILSLFLIASTLHAYAAGSWETAIVGGIEGFNAPGTGLSAGEYLRMGLYRDPWAPLPLRLSFWAGVLVPFNPPDMNSAMIGGGVELQFFASRVREALFVRQWRYAPSVSADLMYAAAGGGKGAVLLAVQPLRFWFGDSFMSFLGTELVLGTSGRVEGWGISLLRIISFVN